MEDQFGQAPLASSPAPALWNGAADAKLLFQAPRNVCPDGPLRCSSKGARVPSPLFVGVCRASAMAAAVTGAARLFAAAWGNFPDILDVQNGGSCLATLVEAPSMTVVPDTFGVTV